MGMKDWSRNKERKIGAGTRSERLEPEQGAKDWNRNKERKIGADLKVYESKEYRNSMKRKLHKMGKK